MRSRLAVAAILAAAAMSCSSSDPVLVERPTTTTVLEATTSVAIVDDRLRTGADVVVGEDFAAWSGKRVGLIAHENSQVDGVHLADHIDRSPAVELVALFGPEHGVRNDHGAGELVADGFDTATSTPVFSLYGETRKPTAEMFADLDVVFYDLQDVGARWYTYISTMGLAMQVAAEHGVEFVVLDRPNPLGGDRMSGFVLDPEFASFVGQYPIPGVYGLTAGELARAIVGERWLPGLEDLDLTVVPMRNWDRRLTWPDLELDWVPPSPGMTTPNTALVYPATVLFEATTVSFGRGTALPFEVVGAPWLDSDELADSMNAVGLSGIRFDPVSFTPDSAAHEGVPVEGVRLVATDAATVDATAAGVHLLLAVIERAGERVIVDRPEFLDKLTGSDRLRSHLASGSTAEQILAEQEIAVSEFAPIADLYYLY